MRRGLPWALAARSLVVAAIVAIVVPFAPSQVRTASAQEPTRPPTASIVVDVDTGEVITAVNARQALPPASTTKMLTALMVRQRFAFDSEITIAPVAALAPPHRLNLVPGQRWKVSDLMYAMMLCSCNDAAWALGMAVGDDDMAGYERAAAALADQLGMADSPLVRDPAGLDDERSWFGGNLLSARDLAIAARAFLDDPVLRVVAATPGHEWTDPTGRARSVRNLNRFLTEYEGAIGVKTGYTDRANLTFAGAATRDGRTLLAIVVDSDDHYGDARRLLDAGFLQAAVGQRTGDVLPPVPDGLVLGTAAPPTTVTSPTSPESTTSPTSPETTTAPETVSTEPAASVPATTPAAAAGPDRDGAGPRPAWVVGGVAGLAVVGGAGAMAARARRRRHRIDRRPARPRLRDRWGRRRRDRTASPAAAGGPSSPSSAPVGGTGGGGPRSRDSAPVGGTGGGLGG